VTDILFFECRRLLKKFSTWLFFISFLLLGYMAISRAAHGSGLLYRVAREGEGLLMADSPFMIMAMVSFLYYMLTLVVATLFASLANRDDQHHHREIYFSLPLSKFDYLAGRFLSGVLVSSFIASGMLIGASLAGYSAGEMGHRFCHPGSMAYWGPFLGFILPTVPPIYSL